MAQTIFSPEPHRGWLPWAWLSPIVCILLVGFSSVPFDLVLERLDLMDANNQPASAAAFCVFLLVPFAAMGAAVWAWSRFVEKRSLATLGLTGAQPLRKFLIGLAIGIGMIGFTITAIWLFGGYRAEEGFPAFASPAALFWIVMLLLCFGFQSGVEEFIFRGWLLSAATRRWNLTAGFIASSVAFTFLHLSRDTTILQIMMSLVFALFACAWAWRANSIWGVMAWHAGWNWITGVGFDVPITGFDVQLPALLVRLVPIGPDYLTGGADGPENSVVTIGMLALATVLLLVIPRRPKDQTAIAD
jgi:uncharacterized protein